MRRARSVPIHIRLHCLLAVSSGHQGRFGEREGADCRRTTDEDEIRSLAVAFSSSEGGYSGPSLRLRVAAT